MAKERKPDLNSCPRTPVLDIEGSPDVFTNSFRQHRVGDRDVCCIQAEGSPNVFANTLRIARLGDRNTCYGPELTGSPDVFANNRPVCRAIIPRDPGVSAIPSTV